MCISGTGDRICRKSRFGPFELLLQALELRKQGTPLKFAAHGNQILAVLTPNPGELITGEEL